jgi:light-harvesting complex 1 beta chain
MASDNNGYGSGLTETQAKEFHGFFMTSFIVFVLIAIVAHALVWSWRPWIPGPNGYGMIDGARSVVETTLSMLS